MSKKCSTFARFFAARAYVRTYTGESMEQKLTTKQLTKTS